MEDFLEEVYDSVFMEESVDKKISFIETTMDSYQNAMWEKLREYFNKN